MKPLLMVVPLYPGRHPLCQEWLEKELDIADIRYLQPGPVGPDIYGTSGQLYTGGAINKELFERVYPEWQKCKHQFFGMCYDDVIVTSPEKPLQKAINCLKWNLIPKCHCVGIFNDAQKTGDFRDYCSRFWIVPTHMLLQCSWHELWRRWEYPDWEGPWLRHSGLKGDLLPGLEFNHLLSEHDEAGNDKGWHIEYYKGRDIQVS